MTKLYLNQYISWLSYLILLVGIVFVVKARRDKDLNGFISFGEGFKTGFFMSFLTSLIVSVFSLIMLKFIAPDMVDNVLKVTEQRMVDKGLSDDQVNMAMEMTRKFMTPTWMFIAGLVLFTLFGTVASLIVAAIFRKEPQQLQQPQ